ncbi:hypothetical protein BHE74_00047001 [Ensete ventricosum]|uniref:Uncharacterized protein n=1 Tax=Ensete ventricosum TaxID=4639 RepID=A0A426Z455_ENSVE|nr:hypothetical protein B296_00046356 [Ensete ventricosum]RWV80958.1 hypothetical protein GW17_00057684 [Ensete ventricosum]RWW47046.1 hypothetical protein BHE74_00047001 [Ensete ventricosum]RZS20557.1 hypothetical protein BHM03_00053088 [Ensete ventricosum]
MAVLPTFSSACSLPRSLPVPSVRSRRSGFRCGSIFGDNEDYFLDEPDSAGDGFFFSGVFGLTLGAGSQSAADLFR